MMHKDKHPIEVVDARCIMLQKVGICVEVKPRPQSMRSRNSLDEVMTALSDLLHFNNWQLFWGAIPYWVIKGWVECLTSWDLCS